MNYSVKPVSLPEFTSFVGGQSLAPAGTPMALVDPATGATWATAWVDASAANAAVAHASAAFRLASWQAETAISRARLLRKLGDLIAKNAAELGELESLANGKPFVATAAEMRATAQWYHYYASAIEIAGSQQLALSATSDATIMREPLGVVVAITPFNGALSLGSWKLAPALAMGNVVILKPPAEAPASSIRLAQLALEAGFPAGVVSVVIGDAQVGQALVTHPDVAMVSFTGSSAAARQIGAKTVGTLKRYVCEAGGKSAHIVFADADLESAAIAATQGVFSATGQTCVAGSRILVQASVLDRFMELFTGLIATLRVGMPADSSTHLGPIASRRHLDRIEGMVDDAVAQGARILLGGAAPAIEGVGAGGFWFAPTVLVDVDSGMRIWRDEVFGPVAVVRAFDTEEQAIALANDSEFGLAAGFWTRDMHRARRVSRQLQAGTIWVNTYRAINMRVPFGGYKQSGIGRENGIEALDEFCQVKSVVIDYAPARNPFAA